jgi:threonine dehydrogenase-like Zn-dependent dehydrogenase
MIGKHDHQLELARKLGAYAVINTTIEDSMNRILEITEERGADKVYECVGGSSMARTLPQAVSLVRRGGKIALVGWPGPDVPFKLDWNKILEQEIDLISVSSFSYWGNDPEFKIVLNLLINGKINPGSLITHRFHLTEINEAFEIAANKKETKAIKVVIVA